MFSDRVNEWMKGWRNEPVVESCSEEASVLGPLPAFTYLEYLSVPTRSPSTWFRWTAWSWCWVDKQAGWGGTKRRGPWASGEQRPGIWGCWNPHESRCEWPRAECRFLGGVGLPPSRSTVWGPWICRAIGRSQIASNEAINGWRNVGWALGHPVRPLLPDPQVHQGPLGQKAKPLDWLATLTDLCKQCAAVRIHWWWMRDPLQMYMPRNRMLACHGHLPTSTNFPFTILQEMLVWPQACNQESEEKRRKGAIPAPCRLRQQRAVLRSLYTADCRGRESRLPAIVSSHCHMQVWGGAFLTAPKMGSKGPEAAGAPHYIERPKQWGPDSPFRVCYEPSP